VVNNIARDFGVIRLHAGVAKRTLHDLRRSAITNWAQKLPIQVVQQLAGHSDISTTRKYYLAVRSEDLDFSGKLIDSTNWKLLLCKWLEDFGGVAQLVRAWDS